MKDWAAGIQDDMLEEWDWDPDWDSDWDIDEIIGDIEQTFFENICIKGEPDHCLAHCIEKCSEHLQDIIAEEYGFVLVEGKNRRKQLKQLSEKIIEEMFEQLAKSKDEDIELFVKIAAGTRAVEEFTGGIVFCRKGWVFYFTDNEKEGATAVVPDEVIDRLKELSRNKDFERRFTYYHIFRLCLKAYLSLYGVFEKQWLFREVERYYYKDMCKERLPQWEPDELLLEPQWEPDEVLLELQESEDFGVEDGLVFELDLEEDYKKRFAAAGDKPFYEPSDEEIKFYSENDFDESSKEYRAVRRYLRKKVGEQKLDLLMVDLSIEVEEELGGMNSLSEILDRYGVLFSSEEDLKDFEHLFKAWEDLARKWSNRGYTNLELRERGEAGSYAVMEWDFSKLGQEAEPDPDDPCPCGSGKRYKQCCGRVKR